MPKRARGRATEMPSDVREQATRQLFYGAAALAASVLADSAMDHYRARFYNPAMYVAPTVAALTVGTGIAAARAAPRPTRADGAIFTLAALAGIAGFGFHSFNVSRRAGGWGWQNLFYGAPVAAPLGLTSAGLLGLAAGRTGGQSGARERPTLLGLPAGVVVARGAAAGLLGTAAEAGVLHLRGAFHRWEMYIPITVPPLAALALTRATLRPTRRRRRLARALLRATAVVGIGGVGFHAHGIHRSMGGWRNWSQNLLAGPPLPAPPAFTGMALAGLAGLSLLEEAA